MVRNLVLCLMLLVVLAPWAGVSAQPTSARCAICAVLEGSGPEPVRATLEHGGKTYAFCAQTCKEKFLADPARWAAQFDAISRFDGPGRYGQLPALEYERINSSEWQNKVVIVDFWATWCGPCVTEIPEFIALQGKYPDDLRIVGFSYDQDAAAHQEFVQKKGLNYPSLLAGDDELKPFLRRLIKQVGPIKAIPVTLLVDRKGEIIFRQTGVIGAEFKQALERELQAK